MCDACLIEGECVAQDFIHPYDPCRACRAQRVRTDWSDRDERSPCNGDDNGCTEEICRDTQCVQIDRVHCPSDGFVCTNDVCSSTGAYTHQCAYPLRQDRCIIDGACVRKSDTDPIQPCRQCNPTATTGAWSPVPDCGVCTPGAPCEENDALCPGGTCNADGCLCE